MQTERYEKEEEESVIPPSYTVVHPRTMVIKCLKQNCNDIHETPSHPSVVQKLIAELKCYLYVTKKKNIYMIHLNVFITIRLLFLKITQRCKYFQ